MLWIFTFSFCVLTKLIFSSIALTPIWLAEWKSLFDYVMMLNFVHLKECSMQISRCIYRCTDARITKWYDYKFIRILLHYRHYRLRYRSLRVWKYYLQLSQINPIYKYSIIINPIKCISLFLPVLAPLCDYLPSPSLAMILPSWRSGSTGFENGAFLSRQSWNM